MGDDDLRVIVAVGNDTLRAHILAVVARVAVAPYSAMAPYDARSVDPANKLIFLETNDDAAELVDTVHSLHRSSGATGTLPVVALLSSDACVRNPGVLAWHIMGRAAVIAVLASDVPGSVLDMELEGLLRLWARGPADQTPEADRVPRRRSPRAEG